MLVFQKIIPTLQSTVKWETRHASFLTGRVDSGVWIFLSPLITNVGFYLSYISPPACGKDKYKQPHVGRKSIRDVIVMLKLRNHVTSQCIQDFLEVHFMFGQYKMRYLQCSCEQEK